MRSVDHGVPCPEGFHRWSGLDVGRVLVGIGARIVLDGGNGLGRVVAARAGWGGAVSGWPWEGGQVASIVVQYVDRQPW